MYPLLLSSLQFANSVLLFPGLFEEQRCGVAERKYGTMNQMWLTPDHHYLSEWRWAKRLATLAHSAY